MLPNAQAEPAHITLIKVRGYHLDIYGHVNNARYLEFLEEARWAWFEANDVVEAFTERGLAFVLVNANINYRRPAFPGEHLEIRTRIEGIGKKSCRVSQTIWLHGTETLVADAMVTFALMDMASHAAVPVEGELRQKLEALSIHRAG
ncbi:acyl-CoA thioesterase [Mangrovitalea sediminis]|uniref:acyl-CoA thioesterase n=1 Tax=Mangrovitalea sediminis TaxID=1982043 RepID=UPI000BE519E5|nr:thioesterase family protein [Mangrovitalea sediminis]